MDNIIVAYIPVVHQGYLNYLASTGAKKIYALEASDLPQFSQLAREVRALTVEQLRSVLHGFGYEVHRFSELDQGSLSADIKIYVPEDDVTRSIIFEREVVWGNWFLRWDWSKSTAIAAVQPSADHVIRKDNEGYGDCSHRMLKLIKEAQKSSDWWRQVGALAVAKDGTCLVAYNKHYPHEHVQYMDGDPRDNFSPGEFIEVTTALHGEQALIADAARRGVSLEEAELYVTVFPCNLCAPWVVVAGFKSVFFAGGYSNLNGQKTLRDHGVELIYVEI